MRENDVLRNYELGERRKAGAFRSQGRQMLNLERLSYEFI